MKVVKQINNISDKLKKQIPTFKRGEVVTFQMLNGKKNDDPDRSIRDRQPYLYPATQIPMSDRIFDPYQKNDQGEEVGGYVDIIVAEAWDGDKPVAPSFFMPGLEAPQFAGRFSLYIGSIQDDEKFEFLSICNRNESNPNRDKSIPALFKMLDKAQESKKKAATADIAFEAQTKARALEVPEAKEIAASLNWPEEKEENILMESLRSFAHENPAMFLDIANGDPKKRKMKTDIKAAIDKQILSFDPITGKLSNKANAITTLEIGVGVDLLEEVTKWMGNAANGEDIMKSIRTQLKK